MSLELTVLGASGSYGAPAGGACSGYLVRSAGAAVWLDCGNGTLVNLQRHLPVEDLTAVVVTHRHPDHCVDLFGLHTLLAFYLERGGPPVYAPAEVLDSMSSMSSHLDDGTFEWDEVGEGDSRLVGDLELRFALTDHPPPTVAVEIASATSRLVYTADTGPGWSPAAFGERPELLLSEATYQRGAQGAPIHLTAAQAAEAAEEVGARRLMLTHLSPLLDPSASIAEAGERFAGELRLAAPHLRVRI